MATFMRCGTVTLAAVLVLSGLPGCRMFERLNRDRSPAEPASRTKDKDWLRERQDREGPPQDWLAGPPPAGRGHRVPPAENWGEPASRNQRTLSGIVEDADGRPIPNTYVTIENADAIKAGYGAPMGVETDRDGYFEINGLNAGEHYLLSAQANRGGRMQAGRLSVQVPNTRLRLRLKEDYQLPPSRGPVSDLPPAPTAGALPPKATDTPPPKDGSNNDWSPLGPRSADPPSRGDLVAPGPTPDWRSTMPPANIPAPSVPPPPSPFGPSSKAPPRDTNLTVLGREGKPFPLLTSRAADLILLDFMTTTCGPCKKAIPALVSFHERFGRKVEVMAIVCDPGTDRQRVDLAASYRAEHRLPYAVNAESNRSPLQDAFAIEAYPTLVLIDGTGRRLWSGHPKNLADLERIIQSR